MASVAEPEPEPEPETIDMPKGDQATAEIAQSSECDGMQAHANDADTDTDPDTETVTDIKPGKPSRPDIMEEIT